MRKLTGLGEKPGAPYCKMVVFGLATPPIYISWEGQIKAGGLPKLVGVLLTKACMQQESDIFWEVGLSGWVSGAP